MPKWAKTFVGVLLLPVCFAGVVTLFRVVHAGGRTDAFWVAFLGGAACWLAVFLLLPKPMWVYVLGHELTHVLWAWLFAGRVKKFKVGSKGGHVVITKTNFVIALAPYFFPIYAVLVLLVFLLGAWLWDWERHVVWFHLLLGAAYAFHVTLTWHILQTRQSDLTQHGYLFSAVIIFLGNLAVLVLGLPLLTGRPGVLSALGWWFQETGGLLQGLGHLVARLR